MEEFYYEMRLSGSGGQGLILAGIIIAEAAVLDGFNVSQTQSYGPEARGGASRSDVVLSNSVIYYPKTTKLDLLLALTQEACDKYFFALKPEGLLIIDSSNVNNVPTTKAIQYPITMTAREKFGTTLVTNIISLGIIQIFSNVISKKSLKEAVANRVPPHTKKLNLEALELGFNIGEKLKKKYNNNIKQETNKKHHHYKKKINKERSNK